MRIPFVLSAVLATAWAAVPADEVVQVPGYNKTSFKVYSGYITVKGPFKLSDYDELRIHYQLDCSQGSPEDPLVTWHQGGPGGSSFIGLYTEMGYFQIGDAGQFTNDFSWNRVSNMLYLESPAGSSDPVGFSTCLKGGVVQERCHWDDRSQAEAYAATLLAFLELYPEFKRNELYLTGESYAGQYVPNIANYILSNNVSLNLKGIAVGNGCWGGTENSVICNGPHGERIDVDLFYGKGLFSKKLKDEIYTQCGYDGKSPRNEVRCQQLMLQMDREVGPHNVYNIYDNCPEAAQWFEKSGKTAGWLRRYLRDNMNTPSGHLHETLTQLGGGYAWACGGMQDSSRWFHREDVQRAMHLDRPGQSRFGYTQSGPASVLLYPKLVKQIRVLIYNGDADACVPYIGNEYWTTQMAVDGHIVETQAWHPWYEANKHVPAGYATTYNVTGSQQTFNFITIRLAGHMVPQFQPGAAFSFFERFIKNQPF